MGIGAEFGLSFSLFFFLNIERPSARYTRLRPLRADTCTRFDNLPVRLGLGRDIFSALSYFEKKYKKLTCRSFICKSSERESEKGKTRKTRRRAGGQETPAVFLCSM